jgi:hypothetical protein
MAAVGFTAEVDSTAAAVDNSGLVARFKGTAGACGHQPFNFSCDRFIRTDDTSYALFRIRLYTEGAPA